MTERELGEPAVVQIVAAVILDVAGRVLLVRKEGTDAFMQPGGKREAGETDLIALARELHEGWAACSIPAHQARSPSPRSRGIASCHG